MNGVVGRIADLASRQDGVVSTRQLLGLGASQSWIDRQVVAGRWQRLHRGVLVVWSGPTPWPTRARAALVLAGAGAALSHHAAAFVHEMIDRPPRSIDVSIPCERSVRAGAGVVVHRRSPVPPAFGRLRAVERTHTVVDLLGTARSADEAIAAVAAGARAGAAPAIVRELLLERRTLPGRALGLELCALAENGVESPLELRYHRDVERRHGLPRAELQVRDVVDGRWVRADCWYRDQQVVVELDGALWHTGWRRDDDVWRDNAVLLARSGLTLRYRWRHVAITPCRTAGQVAQALRARGWNGSARPCGPGCALPTAARAATPGEC